jgi:hypothetical protein
MGHSLMAPVGRWQKGKDLSWYAKADDKLTEGETAEEKRLRDRKEEIRKIKEAEEDALARALGLPVPDRGATGSNAITVGEVNRVVKEEHVGEDNEGRDDIGKGKGFGDFVGKVAGGGEGEFLMEDNRKEGGLAVKDGERKSRRKGRSRSRSRERRHRPHRHRSRSGERRKYRSRSGDRHRHHRRGEGEEERTGRPRSRSPRRRERRHGRSSERYRDREERNTYDERPRRSRSPESRDHRRERDLDRRRRS